MYDEVRTKKKNLPAPSDLSFTVYSNGITEVTEDIVKSKETITCVQTENVKDMISRDGGICTDLKEIEEG